MPHTKNKSRRGSALIEFTLLGIPTIFIMISVVSMSIDAWEYTNLAWAVDQTARYATVHGATCGQNGNSCSITIGTMANYFISSASALTSGTASVSFTDASGVATTCNPVSSCISSATAFPGASYNAVGSDIKVSATYTLTNPFPLYWPGNQSVLPGSFNVGATSRQRIEF